MLNAGNTVNNQMQEIMEEPKYKEYRNAENAIGMQESKRNWVEYSWIHIIKINLWQLLKHGLWAFSRTIAWRYRATTIKTGRSQNAWIDSSVLDIFSTTERSYIVHDTIGVAYFTALGSNTTSFLVLQTVYWSWGRAPRGEQHPQPRNHK